MRYTKKPVTIEAITFDELVAHGMKSKPLLINGLPHAFKYANQLILRDGKDCYSIPTLEGRMEFHKGDMLITGIQGEIYPCKLDIFKATYDKEVEV